MNITMITRTGYILNENSELKKELTVRPNVNNEFGFPPPPFKVFRCHNKKMCIPQFYDIEKFGNDIKDTRPEPAKMTSGINFVGKLNEKTRQPEAFSAGIKSGCGILSLPCGYGKTTVALAIACNLGYRTMIMVHKEFLANQWRERIEQFCPGAKVGIVQRDKVEVEGYDFVIAMLQTMSQKEHQLSDFESIGTLIVDEAHHICARVFSQSLFKLCPRHTYGLSATPIRKDGLTRVLHWFLGPTFFVIDRDSQGDVVVNVVKYEHSRFREPPPCNRIGKLSLVEMITNLVEMPERNKLIVKIIKKASKGSRQILVLSDRRNHCIELQSSFQDISGLYMGGMSEDDLSASSKKKIIFGTFSQAHEGLDIPTLDTLVMVTPKTDVKQSVGRILREVAGKKNAPQIWDIYDQWSILHAMQKKRLGVYKSEGFVVRGYEDDEPQDEKMSGFLFI